MYPKEAKLEYLREAVKANRSILDLSVTLGVSRQRVHQLVADSGLTAPELTLLRKDHQHRTKLATPPTEKKLCRVWMSAAQAGLHLRRFAIATGMSSSFLVMNGRLCHVAFGGGGSKSAYGRFGEPLRKVDFRICVQRLPPDSGVFPAGDLRNERVPRIFVLPVSDRFKGKLYIPFDLSRAPTGGPSRTNWAWYQDAWHLISGLPATLMPFK